MQSAGSLIVARDEKGRASVRARIIFRNSLVAALQRPKT
jgi:hypothetical protein